MNDKEIVKLLLKVKHKLFMDEDDYNVELPFIHEYVENIDVNDKNNWKSGLSLKGDDFLSDHKNLVEMSMIELGLVDSKQFFEKGIFKPGLLGKYLMKVIHFKTIEESNEIFYYNNGYYKPNGQEKIREMSTKILKDEFKNYFVNETIAYIQGLTYTKPTINMDWINLENGLLNPLTMIFKNHTPDIFSVVRIPIEYNTKAICPIWEKILKDKLEDELYKTLQEWFGYQFLQGQKYQKAIMLYGEENSGKSTLLRILNTLLGDENTMAFSLQQLNDDNFAGAYLYGKAANIYADITTKTLRDTSFFLTLVGGDKITKSKKNEHHKTWYPDTKLSFSGNIIPPTTNKHLAFYKRWILIDFGKKIPTKKIDRELDGKIEKELAGILNWSIRGLQRLEKNKKFSYSKTPEDIKDLYEMNSNTIQSFIYNKIDMEKDEGALTKREVFEEYKKYCKKNKIPPENVITFGRMFIALTGCGTGKKGTGLNSLPAYKGVNWKNKISKKKSIEDYTTDNDNENDKECI